VDKSADVGNGGVIESGIDGKGTSVEVRLKLALIDTGDPGSDVDSIPG